MMHPAVVTESSRLYLAAASLSGGDEMSNESGHSHTALGKRSLHVLVVEDEFFISLHTKELLQALGHTVVGIAVSANQAVQLAERDKPDVVLMDIRLNGDRDGIEAAEEIYRRLGIQSIFVSANSDPRTRERAAALQPLGFLQKPLSAERLEDGLRVVR
jgi:two-component system, response regulator PdtaR